MASEDRDENILLRAALQGNLEAFNALVLHYQDAVYTLTYRVMGDAESAADATQEAFISAYRRLETFRGDGDGGGSTTSFKAWLLRIATNACYDELRRRKRRPATHFDEMPGGESDDGPALPSSAATPEEHAQQRELVDAIQDCMNGLADDQRVTLVMFDLEGYSYNEIADSMSVQLGTVKSRLSRARLNMRRCLETVQELLPVEFRLKE